MHLIPHALNPHDHGGEESHSHGHSHSDEPHDHTASTIVGLSVLAGLITFLLIEKLVKHVKGEHSHTHSHGPVATQKKEKGSDDEESKDGKKKGIKQKKDEKPKG